VLARTTVSMSTCANLVHVRSANRTLAKVANEDILYNRTSNSLGPVQFQRYSQDERP
jgi:hypothetical protein